MSNLPKPYYEEPGIMIYHGDCREILPSLRSVGLILTDPPWPMEKTEIMQGSRNFDQLWADVCPKMHARRLLIWHGIHNDPRRFLNPLASWPYLRLIYIRRAIPGYFGRVLMDGEAIHALGEWPAQHKGAIVIPGGLSITYQAHDRHNGHPGPRSLLATKWLLRWWSDPGDIVLDPFVGSGTTLVAAKQLGHKAIGIEIEEKYCEIAVQRLAQAQLEFPDSQPKRELAELQTLWDSGHPDRRGIKQAIDDWVEQDAHDALEGEP